MQECGGEHTGPILNDLLECFKRESGATEENKTLMSKSDSSKRKALLLKIKTKLNKRLIHF